jgi:hypothetical protein
MNRASACCGHGWPQSASVVACEGVLDTVPRFVGVHGPSEAVPKGILPTRKLPLPSCSSSTLPHCHPSRSTHTLKYCVGAEWRFDRVARPNLGAFPPSSKAASGLLLCSRSSPVTYSSKHGPSNNDLSNDRHRCESARCPCLTGFDPARGATLAPHLRKGPRDAEGPRSCPSDSSSGRVGARFAPIEV